MASEISTIFALPVGALRMVWARRPAAARAMRPARGANRMMSMLGFAETEGVEKEGGAASGGAACCLLAVSQNRDYRDGGEAVTRELPSRCTCDGNDRD